MTFQETTLKDTTLADFGWTSFFDTQIDHDETTDFTPARVIAVHRDSLHVAGPGVDRLIRAFSGSEDDDEAAATVGDWLLLDRDALRPRRLLRRKSLFKRRAAGSGRRLQLIAANVDTLFIVSSCNHDFNTARLERYLALARDTDVMPLMVLTKADLCDDPESYARQARALMPGLLVEPMDARGTDPVDRLAPWCARGQTVALAGSSGVGKSTLINTLLGEQKIASQGIREDDSKGRHTTSARTLHRLPGRGWLLDTPGMRELQLTDSQAGIEDVFADLADLARACRFADCRHETEPGCAVKAALDAGTIDADRLRRWRKLVAEDIRNSESIAQRRARDRAFGRMIKGVQKSRQRREHP